MTSDSCAKSQRRQSCGRLGAPGPPNVALYHKPNKIKSLSDDRFYTFPVFRFGSLLKTILEHLGVDFGVVLGSIFDYLWDQRGDQNFDDFFISLLGSKLRPYLEPIAMEAAC